MEDKEKERETECGRHKIRSNTTDEHPEIETLGRGWKRKNWL